MLCVENKEDKKMFFSAPFTVTIMLRKGKNAFTRQRSCLLNLADARERSKDDSSV